jgi:hypothetical protein
MCGPGIKDGRTGNRVQGTIKIIGSRDIENGKRNKKGKNGKKGKKRRKR